MLGIIDLEEDGVNIFQDWLKTCSENHQKMARSMIECLEVIGLKCRYVKAIEPKGLFELKSKSTGVRVYFFIDDNCAILVNGTIKTYKTEDKLKQRNDILRASRLMKSYFENM